MEGWDEGITVRWTVRRDTYDLVVETERKMQHAKPSWEMYYVLKRIGQYFTTGLHLTLKMWLLTDEKWCGGCDWPTTVHHLRRLRKWNNKLALSEWALCVCNVSVYNLIKFEIELFFHVYFFLSFRIQFHCLVGGETIVFYILWKQKRKMKSTILGLEEVINSQSNSFVRRLNNEPFPAGADDSVDDWFGLIDSFSFNQHLAGWDGPTAGGLFRTWSIIAPASEKPITSSRLELSIVPFFF